MRPILDEDKRNEIIGVISVGGTYALAARKVGCSRQTIRRTAARDPEFRRRLNEARAAPEHKFLKTIEAAAGEKKYWQAAKWALQHEYPDRYGRKPRTMTLADVKDLVTQLLEAVLQVIPDSTIRAAVRRRVYKVSGDSLRKAKEHTRDR